MKNQILEMLASPSVETVMAFVKTLLQAPQDSPLIAAGSAGVLCLIVAALFGRWRRRRQLHKINESWQVRLDELNQTNQSKLTELDNSKSSLGKQVETLQTKLQSMEKTLEQDRTTLHKANANVKTLEVAAAEKDQKLQKTIDDAAHKIAQHQASLKKANALLEARNAELKALKSRQLDAASLPISASLLTSINERDEGYASQLAKRIDKLDEQRSALLRERDELASREAHYTHQLIDGDDTRVYLDETIAINDELDQLVGSGAMQAESTPDEIDDTLAVDQLHSTEPSTHDQTTRTSTEGTTAQTLWDRVKTSVVKTTDRTKIEKSDA
ncbi:MAG: hypothetical protein KTR32_05340 [Granulosicoccus sp.]|nr:hypothetical protein [Granulosicoccus sp.]